MALFFGEELGYVFSVLVFVDDDVFGCGDKAVLDAAVAAKAFLIGPSVEETDVERVVFLQFGQEDGIGVRVGIVVVFAVAGEAAEEYALVFAIPMVDGQHDKTLVDAPGVRQGGDEGTVYHIPHLAVVLLLLVEDAVKGGAAFAYGKTAELSEYIGFFHLTDGANVLDLRQHFFGHVLIVVGSSKRGLAGKATTNVE